MSLAIGYIPTEAKILLAILVLCCFCCKFKRLSAKCSQVSLDCTEIVPMDLILPLLQGIACAVDVTSHLVQFGTVATAE